jgi:4'-phosphopantetheinyl transferase
MVISALFDLAPSTLVWPRQPMCAINLLCWRRSVLMSDHPDAEQSLKELDSRLPPGEVHVWLALLGSNDDAATSVHSILNLDEQQRADRFKVAPAREQYVLSRALLRIVLGKYLHEDPRTISLMVTSHGKPKLTEGSDLDFNLSHTEGLTAIGVTRLGRIGIDVERVHRGVNALEVASRFFSKKEADWVRSQAEEDRIPSFLACWTAKEAYVKAHGEGLSIPLDGFAAIPKPSQTRIHLEVFGNAEESRRWSMRRLDLPSEFRGAIAVEATSCKLRVGELASVASFTQK